MTMNTVQFTGVAGVLPGDSSKSYTTPWPVKPGTRARDVDGNEYLFTDYLNTMYPGTLAVINELNQAGPLLIGSRGRVGVVMGGGTSDAGGWVQIFGSNIHVQTGFASDAVGGFGSGITSAQACAQTSVTTPSGTISWVSDTSIPGNRILGLSFSTLTPVQGGMSGATDGSYPTTYTTQVTDDSGSLGFIAHTGLELAVFLNYPYVTGIVDQFMS